MSFSKLIQILKNLHLGPQRKIAPDPRFGRELQHDLLERHRVLYGGQAAVSGGGVDTKKTNTWVSLRPGYVLPALVLLVAALGAGTLPASYPVMVGSLIVMEFDQSARQLPGIGELLTTLEELEAADQISVSIQEGQGSRIHLVLLGEPPSVDELMSRLVARHGVLSEGRIRSEPLEGWIPGTWGGRIGRALFSIDVSASDVEEARRQIMREFESRGFRATQVDIREEEDQRRIKIEMKDRD